MTPARPRHPNRIKEIRTVRGLSAEKLGKLCGTSQQQIQRLEVGERRLTQEWMEKIAKALRIAPADLLPGVVSVSADDVVEADLGVPGVSRAMKARGLHVYRCRTNALAAIGIESDQILTIDTSPDAVSGLVTGDVVLVSIRSGEGQIRLLRQYFEPRAYLTNPRAGALSVLLADDPMLQPTVLGVRIVDTQ